MQRVNNKDVQARSSSLLSCQDTVLPNKCYLLLALYFYIHHHRNFVHSRRYRVSRRQRRSVGRAPNATQERHVWCDSHLPSSPKHFIGR